MQPAYQPPLGTYAQPGFQGAAYQPIQQGYQPMPPAQLNYPQPGYPPQFEMQGMPGVIPYNPQLMMAMMVPPIRDGYEKLAETKGVYVKQQFEIMEALTGCETPNVYKVFPADVNGVKIGSNTIFKCKEKSGCCVRQFCPGDCQPFNMKVSNEAGTLNNGTLDKTLFLHMERPCKCTCMCFNRPQMSVTFVEKGANKFIGKIKNPCYFCSIGVTIEDAAGNLKYMVEGTQCQMGYLCMGFPCKACQTVKFEVKNASGAVITYLMKQTAGCMKACVGDTTNFSLGFPEGSTPEEKALLISAILFLDYMYFENKQTVRARGHGRTGGLSSFF